MRAMRRAQRVRQERGAASKDDDAFHIRAHEARVVMSAFIRAADTGYSSLRLRCRHSSSCLRHADYFSMMPRHVVIIIIIDAILLSLSITFLIRRLFIDDIDMLIISPYRLRRARRYKDDEMR